MPHRKHGICSLTVIPCRKEPGHSSEMVTELLFGEYFEILDRKNDWFHIKNNFDGYESWVDSQTVLPLSDNDFDAVSSSQQWYAASMISKAVNLKYKVNFNLLIGSNLPFYDGEKFRIGNEDYELLGNAAVIQYPKKDEPQPYDRILLLMKELIEIYKGSPYLWGGRTPFGVDCSGFTQMVFKLCGIALPRDSHLQSLDGETVPELDKSKSGDIAFFTDGDGKIVHTGIIMVDDKKTSRARPEKIRNTKIIHSSGYVRTDKLDNQGIYNTQTRKYTHKLSLIKRHFTA
ncbi:MAG: C40 family peptidase [Bacteroidetes bacterium]|nr:C40 family peptidase [Bacteroidota bacterium]